jgi:regulator of nucleoside diphosphate kinase
MNALPGRGGKPPILLSEPEADMLYDLALTWRQRHPFSAQLLLEELDRARTVPLAELPDDVVTMGSRVVFLDRARGEERSVELVYPVAADMGQSRVSVMTPIGAGLIGMRRGDEIDWPDRQGERRRLKIVAVVQPAPLERAA